ncbi:hypothetical protein COLO4_08750 [Corchorus olitorius]|uniref:Uncharacterized protein n=1 Tax=Corchorus olitorius TaxID=93759 RepID=A0A1R3KEQ7_9ROSI|nr:hypothetical protein COLO4_08750 [Corchorus olitorius]
MAILQKLLLRMNPEIVKGLGITCALIYGNFLAAKYELLPPSRIRRAYLDQQQRIRY